jgi:transcriptional regulator with XRE-family HTH domain
VGDPAEVVGQALAGNLRAARRERGWRLEDLASRSGVSRGMLQQIETGHTNPSVATLARICSALSIPIGRLVEPPAEIGNLATLHGAELRAAGRESQARLLINDGQAPFVELWDILIAADDEIRSAAHPAGTRELLRAHDGELDVEVGGATFHLEPGDALRMRGDRPHAYRNRGQAAVRLTMTVIYSGAQDQRYSAAAPP